ncbi:MAG: hypothetical protein KDL87_11320, partial [Verrucomicrobiae bacterium]|nr:hypothetical protein [Verrucomicrobiae bacterium]
DAYPEDLATDLTAYRAARQLSKRANLIGDADPLLADLLARPEMTDWEISEGLPTAPVSLCLIGQVSAEDFSDAIAALFGGELLEEGALLRVPTVRHAGLINPLRATLTSPLQWMPWRVSPSLGTWLLIWKDPGRP